MTGTNLASGAVGTAAFAPNSVLLLDISRLLWRGRRVAPSGIDRVELAYARHYISSQTDHRTYAVLHLCGFLFAISPAGARRFIDNLYIRWHGAAPAKRRTHLLAVIKSYLLLFTSAWKGGYGLRRKIRFHDAPPIFLVVSHHHVSRDYAINRVRRAFGAMTICLIHDLLPIDYPEYFNPGWAPKYARLAKNTGRLFDAAIANSSSTAISLRAYLNAHCADDSGSLDIRVAPAGVHAFPRPRFTDHAERRPYFIVLGTIEPRKNHLLLLNVWNRLAATVATPPRLIVIGARGWLIELVVDTLERSSRLHGLVEEQNRLTDTAVGALLAHARAVLVPSFAEGFGLPLAEALASGVPVICSDIPVFREVGRGAPEYLDPLDLHAWQEAVLEYSRPDSTRRSAQLLRMAEWRMPTWADHFQVVDRLLRDLEIAHDTARAPHALRADMAARVQRGD
jgi:glycosyltransferase involved in cell wall biosynthesis